MLLAKLFSFLGASRSPVDLVSAASKKNMLGAGMVYKGKKYVTHTSLGHHQSAVSRALVWQILVIAGVIVFFLLNLILNTYGTMVIFVAAITSVYFIDVLFNLFLILKSLHFPQELTFTEAQLEQVDENKLPIYSIMCPLYREKEVLPLFVANMEGLNWPKSKLDVLLLLEENDTETIEVAKSLDLPSYVRVIVVPHSFPKTKPKACNYGLAFARGEYVVIYDAEDKPDSDQLKKAFLAFKQLPEKVACLQAKLNYFNPNYNLLTRLFTAEYSLWFDVVLPGLQSIETTIPLGGTSNHFKTALLRQLKGWDAFNVTEDADLGSRLFKLGYTTAIIDSTTLEEANSNWANWIRQRSRWIKGYLQTFLVHNRDPIRFLKDHGIHALIFQMLMGGRIAFMLINPILWLITISYFALHSLVGPTIESLYPPVVFYMAAFSLVVGNFFFLYYYMIGCAKRGHWTLIKYVYLVPVYWLMISLAAVKGITQLLTKPHYWEKTNHGLMNQKEVVKKEVVAAEGLVGSSEPSFIGQFIMSFGKRLWGGGMVLIVSALVGNFLNFLFNIYLGNKLSLEEFGLISLFTSFLYIAQILFSCLSSTITRVSALYLGKYGVPAMVIWKKFNRWSVGTSIIISVAWMALMPALKVIFKTDDILPFVFFTPVWMIGLLGATNSGFLSGSQKFGVLGVATIIEAATKLLMAYCIVELGLGHVVYAIPASMGVAFLITWMFIRKLNNKVKVEEVAETKTQLPVKFIFTNLLGRLSNIAFLGMDILLAKILLSSADAGTFALVSTVGKMVYFLGGLSNQFVIPLISKEEGALRNPISVFNKILLATVSVCVVGYLGVGVFGFITVPLLFGARARVIVALLPVYILGIVAYTIAGTIVSYHQTRNRFFVPIFAFLFSLFQFSIFLVGRQNVGTFAYAYGYMGMAQLIVAAILHRLTRYSTIITGNTFAFLDLFRKNKEKKLVSAKQLRFLILNWRDTKHAWAGGAEVYVQELAKYFIKEGHLVTVFCGNDGKSKNSEVVDGVQVIRRGGFFTVYVWAFLYYITKFHDSFDVIIDCENGIPFFAPLYSRRPKFLLIHHVHQQFFRDNLPFPVRQIAAFLEGSLMPWVYRDQKIITVSKSSWEDIVRLNFFSKKNVSIVNPGIKCPKLKGLPRKAACPTILYLGRIRPYKNLDKALAAFKGVLKKNPTAIFKIAGDGDCLESLKKLAVELGISESVVFLGKVSEEQKVELFKEAWLMVQPSSIEGWGITVIEANAYGSPVVASNVSGLKDSVVDGKTGILVKAGDIGELTWAMCRIIENPILRHNMSKESMGRARAFDWDNNAREFLQEIGVYLRESYNFDLNTHARDLA